MTQNKKYKLRKIQLERNGRDLLKLIGLLAIDRDNKQRNAFYIEILTRVKEETNAFVVKYRSKDEKYGVLSQLYSPYTLGINGVVTVNLEMFLEHSDLFEEYYAYKFPFRSKFIPRIFRDEKLTKDAMSISRLKEDILSY